MSEDIAGRDAELEAVEDFLAKSSLGPAALVLEGEAGMGKTTLWRAGVASAGGQGLTVLQAQPVESETTLSFAGIGDLLDPYLDEVLDALAAVQRRALERALALGEEEDGVVLDPRVLRVAVMNAIRVLAAERPVLVAIDDSQWLDYASSAALAYGVRRLRTDRVGLLLSRRSGLESVLLTELLGSPAGSLFTFIYVDPLDAAALGRVIHVHLGSSLPRPLLAEVHDASGGNPFFALEIVRMLRRKGVSIEAGQPLPLPESLHDLVKGRVTALSSESRNFLLAAAAHAHPTIANTEAASGVACADGLEPALEAHVVELEGARIRFTHPLLAAGVYEEASPLRRIEVHRRLAELLEDPEARAWQLAASVDEPDNAVAAVLEEAAQQARVRGAPRPAALLLDRARELTPTVDAEDALRRGVEAAYLHFESGDAQRAEAQLRGLVAPLGAGPQRANALWVLARIRTYEAPIEAAELFLQVVSEAGGSRELLAAAHEGVASCLYYALERLAECVQHADAALELARELGDKALEGDVLISKLGIHALLGDPAAAAMAEEAALLQQIASDRRLLDQPLLAVAEYWFWSDAPGRARETFIDLLRQAEEIGDESSRPYLQFLLGEAECVLGDLSGALMRAREGQGSAEQSGQALFAAYNLALQSLAHAQLGDVKQTREAASQAAALTAGTTWYVRLVASSALGHLEHALDAQERVLEHLSETLDFVRREAIAEPCAMRFVVDYVEALIQLGQREEALEVLDWYEGNARRLERASALANCARCRGMLAAQGGEMDEAQRAYGEALGWHAKVDLPLDRGRTLLASGATQRRAKRRRDARATLEEALAVFEGIGAALWAERARAELKRISGRAATPGALTPAEERVAALVADGKTNREVAAALFLSDRTVEGHLAHVFGKLGIRNRTEIAAALVARQTQVVEAPNPGEAPVSAEPSAP